MKTHGSLARRLRAILTVCGLGLGPSVLSAQRALVYCPVGIDPTGCTTLVQALGDSGGPFPQRVDMGYDGTDGRSISRAPTSRPMPCSSSPPWRITPTPSH